MAIYRHNLHPNPRVGSAIGNWSFNPAGASCTFSRETTGGPNTNIPTWSKLSFNTTTTTSPAAIHTAGTTALTLIPVVPGATYTVSGYAYSTESGLTGVRIDMAWYDANASALTTASGTTTAIAADTWEVRNYTAVAPANAAYLRPSMTFSGTDTAGLINTGDFFGTSGMLVEQFASQRDYFDGGSTVDPLGVPMWTATPHASESLLMSTTGGAVSLNNSASAGTDGVTVTTANSGNSSESAWSSVSANGSLTFTTAQRYGGNIAYYIAANSAATCYMTWSLSGSGFYSARAYAYFTAAPSTSVQFMRFYSGQQVASMVVTAGQKIIIQCNGTTVDTSTGTIPLSTWLRFELFASSDSGSGGTIIASVYAGEDTTMPLYTYVNTTADTGSSNPSSFHIGKVTATGDWGPFFVDDIVVRDDTAIGPTNGSIIPWSRGVSRTEPLFVNVYSTGFSGAATTKTITDITTQPGDTVVVYAGIENGSGVLDIPSGNGIAFTLRQSVSIDNNWAGVYIWTGTDDTGGTWTLSNTLSLSTLQWGMTCLIFRGSEGIGASSQANSSSGTALTDITTTKELSAIAVLCVDWTATDGSSHFWATVNGIAPTSGNGLETDYTSDPSAYSVYGGYYNNAGSAGLKTVGITYPSQKYSIVAVEIYGGHVY